MSQPRDPEQILDAAMGELGRRLDENPGEVTSATLARLLDTATRAAERRREREREKVAKDGEPPYDPLEVILLSPLEPKRKRQLIEQEIAKHQAEIERLLGAIEGDDPDE